MEIPVGGHDGVQPTIVRTALCTTCPTCSAGDMLIDAEAHDVGQTVADEIGASPGVGDPLLLASRVGFQVG